MSIDTTEYTEQANKFMTKTGTTMKVEFLEHGLYFDDDKTPRDIYRITLRRGDKSYTFKFGQSASSALRPTAYDVLACLTKYDPGTFEEFADEFGYDIDSRKAEKTFKAVVKEFAGVKRLFGDVIEELAEIA